MAHFDTAHSCTEGRMARSPRLAFITFHCARLSSQSSTWVIPNMPITTGRKGMPSMRSMTPMVKRGRPETLSTPITARKSPRRAESRPLAADSPVSQPRLVRARSMRAAVSGGPKRRPKRASGGAKRVSIRMPNVPAMKEPTAAMKRACPPRPCRARRCPSSPVMMAAESPGMSMSTALTVPPYMQP